MTKRSMLDRDPETGHAVVLGYGPPQPFAWVVKCAGGCGADMLIPMKITHPDGRVESMTPESHGPKWCTVCGFKKFLGLDLSQPKDADES